MQQSFFDISVKKKHVALEKIWVTASKYYLPLTLLFYIGCRWLIPFSTSITISSSSSLLGDEVAVVIAHFSYFISIPGLVTFFFFLSFPKVCNWMRWSRTWLVPYWFGKCKYSLQLFIIRANRESHFCRGNGTQG